MNWQRTKQLIEPEAQWAELNGGVLAAQSPRVQPGDRHLLRRRQVEAVEPGQHRLQAQQLLCACTKLQWFGSAITSTKVTLAQQQQQLSSSPPGRAALSQHPAGSGR